MVTLILVLPGVVLLAWLWRTRPERRRAVLTLVAAVGLGFQVLHVAEHVVQSAVWVGATDQPPFMTPWAVWGADVLAVAGHPSLGQELLHLVGNAVFLVGLVALAALARPAGRWVRVALVVQGAHLLEHVALSLTTAVWGRAIGATTLLGTLEAGPDLWRLRVLAHLALNTVATGAAVAAVIQTLSARSAAPPDSPTTDAPPPGAPTAGPAHPQAEATSPRSRASSTAA